MLKTDCSEAILSSFKLPTNICSLFVSKLTLLGSDVNKKLPQEDPAMWKLVWTKSTQGSALTLKNSSLVQLLLFIVKFLMAYGQETGIRICIYLKQFFEHCLYLWVVVLVIFLCGGICFVECLLFWFGFVCVVFSSSLSVPDPITG